MRSRSCPRLAAFSASASASAEVQGLRRSRGERVAEPGEPCAGEVERRKLLPVRLEQRRMTEDDRQDRDLARRLARLAGEPGLLRQGRFGEAEPGAARRERQRRAAAGNGRLASPPRAGSGQAALRRTTRRSDASSPPDSACAAFRRRLSRRRRRAAARARRGSPAYRNADLAHSRSKQHVGERSRALEDIVDRRRAHPRGRGRRDPGHPAEARTAGFCRRRSAVARFRSREAPPSGRRRRRRSRGPARSPSPR